MITEAEMRLELERLSPGELAAELGLWRNQALRVRAWMDRPPEALKGVGAWLMLREHLEICDRKIAMLEELCRVVGVNR